jgi:hypothetical protein
MLTVIESVALCLLSGLATDPSHTVLVLLEELQQQPITSLVPIEYSSPSSAAT